MRSQLVMRAQSDDRYTWNLDGALPGSHKLAIYDVLDNKEAAILVQCHTNHLRLLTTLWRIQRAKTDKCQCGCRPKAVNMSSPTACNGGRADNEQ